MKKHLVDPSGKKIVVDMDYRSFKRYLKKGYREMKPSERLEYLKNLEKEEIRKIKEVNLLDVFLIAPTSNESDGYGASAKTLKRELEKFGIYLNENYNNQKIGLVYNYPYAVKNLKTPYKIIFTMFESTKMPNDWGEYLSLADLVIVPSYFCKKIMFDQFGIKAKVINLGYDQEVFRLIIREEKKDFTFLHYDAFKWRKGWDLVLNAFDDEFKKDEGVKLIFKTTLKESEHLPLGAYENVKIIHGVIPQVELNELLERSDCFVYPSRGEGFGLPPLEAMATGLPVIIPNAHGISEYYDWQLHEQLRVRPIKAKYDNANFKGMDLGNLFQVELSDLKKAMRKVFENRGEIRENNYKYIQLAVRYTAEKTAKKLAKLIKEGEKEVRENKNKIVFLTEDTQHLTGGRYYSWWLATGLKDIGFDVEIYTNRMPVFINEFKNYPKPTVIIKDDLKKVDVKANMYFGSPVIGNLRACQLAEKYNKKCFCEIFDPFPLMERYKGKHNYPGWDILIPEMRKEHVNIISLADYCNKFIQFWLNKTKRQLITISPCINSREVGEKKEKKENWITFISRLDNHKNIDHVLDAMLNKKLKDYTLQIITSIDGVGIDRMIEKRGLQKKVKINYSISDKEKFKIIKKSKLTVNASTFEGFGIWLAESLVCGVPVACYEYPTFKEIIKYRNKKDGKGKGVYFARHGDKEDLKEKMIEGLERKEKGEIVLGKKYTYRGFKKELKNKIEHDVKIGVLMIALNESEFIHEAVQAVLRNENINKVVLVEGCDLLNKENATTDGLSKDEQFNKIENFLRNKKFCYIPYGFASGKAELRNAGLAVLKEHCNYVLIVDGDEVWSQENLNRLAKKCHKYKDTGVFWFKTLHFWKSYDLLATGGQWDKPLFRFFKFEDKSLHFERHELAPVDKNGVLINLRDGEKFFESIKFYHFGACKNKDNVLKKLEYYKKRDDHLKIVDTFSNWKKGKQTQWTHQNGGKVKSFRGKYPEEMNVKIINSMIDED